MRQGRSLEHRPAALELGRRDVALQALALDVVALVFGLHEHWSSAARNRCSAVSSTSCSDGTGCARRPICASSWRTVSCNDWRFASSAAAASCAASMCGVACNDVFCERQRGECGVLARLGVEDLERDVLDVGFALERLHFRALAHDAGLALRVGFGGDLLRGLRRGFPDTRRCSRTPRCDRRRCGRRRARRTAPARARRPCRAARARCT
jgi:hypothetical protein